VNSTIALDVGVHYPVVVVLGRLDERFGQLHTGVVDEDVQPAEVGRRSGYNLGRNRRTCRIAGDGQCSPAGFTHHPRRLLDFLKASRGDANIGAGLGQVECNGPADAPPSAGDDRDPATQVDVDCHDPPALKRLGVGRTGSIQITCFSWPTLALTGRQAWIAEGADKQGLRAVRFSAGLAVS
jgi:hypothetical protein